MANAGNGDRLARGAARATFGPVEKVSDEKWKAAFDDFDSEKFMRGDADSESTGSAGTRLKETVKRNKR